MTTRRRRLGSETEHQNSFASTKNQDNILKGPSLSFQGSDDYNQLPIPLFFVGPQANPIAPPLSIPSTPSIGSFTSNKVDTDNTMASLAANNLTLATYASSDRTSEFISTVRSLQSRTNNGMTNHSQVLRKNDNPQYSDFMRVAKIISKDLNNTYTKLEKLTLLAKKRSLFEDRPQEIEQLTYIIREDITNLNKQIGQLKELTGRQQNHHQRNTKTHSTNIMVGLQSKLASMSSEFKQVLDVRTENLKAQKSRRQQFTGNQSVMSDLPVGALTGGPLGTQNGSKGSVLLHYEYEAQKGEAVSLDMGFGGTQQNQQLIYADETDQYLQGRADAVQNIESTVVELGGIFQQLALLVQEQQENVERIDSNVEDALLNVESGHDELLRYFRSVSSNRWLMMKIFGVITAFVIIFAVFLA